MNSITTTKAAALLAGCSASLFLGLGATASPATADPGDPVVSPGPVVVAPAPPAAVPAPPAAVPILPAAATVQSADTDAAPLPAPAADPAVPIQPNGVPHLPSPDALPPGSTLQRPDDDSPNVNYWKNLWQAVQDHEISGKEALIMGFAQRGMNSPYPDQPPGPNVPLRPTDAAPLAPAPAVPLPAAAPAPAPLPAAAPAPAVPLPAAAPPAAPLPPTP